MYVAMHQVAPALATKRPRLSASVAGGGELKDPLSLSASIGTSSSSSGHTSGEITKRLSDGKLALKDSVENAQQIKCRWVDEKWLFRDGLDPFVNKKVSQFKPSISSDHQ